ncbi:hypothetical protein Y032_0120g939 [Ancylostoma ceylanicum]|uniref:Uncharacterized protein n=1 Tax=Ancylostoma ceylanicum TaxID=53326 RepID=A0A016TAS5_9BILA|nr:hypothetical protein Y032_0120g939 [Ancylostoma ceylanicum]
MLVLRANGYVTRRTLLSCDWSIHCASRLQPSNVRAALGRNRQVSELSVLIVAPALFLNELLRIAQHGMAQLTARTVLSSLTKRPLIPVATAARRSLATEASPEDYGYYPDPLEHATGREKKMLLARLAGDDTWYSSP